MTACGFSFAHYRDVLTSARARYAFAAFDERPADARPFLLLRHDLDFSLELALPLARIEAELGARATYFVLPHGDYNPYGDPGLGVLREIVGLGHRLGLHYDLGFYDRHRQGAAETIRREAATLADRLGTPVAVAAEHNPGRAPRPPDLDTSPLLDAYSPAFTRDVKYLSDSCQSWREGCVCGHLDPARHPRLQVLTHPVWWSEDGRNADLALAALTASRVAAVHRQEREVRDHYAGLEHLGNRDLFRRGKA